MRVGVIGAGMIGTTLLSLASEAYSDFECSVFDVNASNVDAVLRKFPCAQKARTLAELSSCDIVFVCTPVSLIPQIVCDLIGAVDDAPIIVDVGSTKQDIVAAVRARCPDYGKFVPGHPMAGSSASGPEGAEPDALRRRPFILTPDDVTEAGAVEFARSFIAKIGMKPAIVPPDAHDSMVALTSHLTHLVSYGMVQRFIERGSDAESSEPPATFVGGSFRCVSHFASAEPNVWADIFMANAEKIREELSAVASAMHAILDAAEKGERAETILLLRRLRDAQTAIEE